MWSTSGLRLAHVAAWLWSATAVAMPLLASAAEQSNEGKFGIAFSGFVKTDVIFDSRQTVSLREGHFLLYPAAPSNDVTGEDVSEKANLNMMSIQTRVTAKLTAPEAFGAKPSGLIEAEFFGSSDADVNGFRLRHAFLSLQWPKTGLMIGQFWHPLFVTEVFPQVVSFNTGAPFQPFSRNPQVRLTQALGSARLIAAAASQRDFTSPGPNGNSSTYLRNAVLPDLSLQLQYRRADNVYGAGIDFKILTPQITTSQGYKTDETVKSTAGIGYAKLKLGRATLGVEAVYGQNLSDHLMLGGYGVRSTDPATGKQSYIPTSSFSVWSDLYAGKRFQPGLFLGYAKNLGAGEIVSKVYVRNADIDSAYRIAPRMAWQTGYTRLSVEIEYTAAAYGTTNERAKVVNTTTVGNLRMLFAGFLFF
ncbi:MAG: hypothetical protein AB1714_19960 [Acidobacteriota bacterium]